MKNKRTVSNQIVCSVIIIGVIIIVLLTMSKSLFSKSRNEFYSDLLTKVSDSGEKFFSDNSKYIPKEIFESQKVSIGTLVANDYIDTIVDFNKKECSNDSYVIAIKMDDNKYVYRTCLVCDKDDYSNMNETYCDSSWVDSSTISYGIIDEPLFYLNKGSSIDNKLDLSLSLIKRNYNGDAIAVLSKSNFVKISPNNMSLINPNVVGEYILDYEYEGYVSQGKLIVYENPSPRVSIGYENKVAVDYSNSTKTESGYLENGKWAQKIILTFSKGDNYHSNISSVVKYQWNKDGYWQDICVGEEYCAVEIDQEMDEKVKFRSVDNHGNSSAETKEYLIRIDNTKPNCELNSRGVLGDNNWYKSDIVIAFSRKNDNLSGVLINNINVKNSSLSKELVEEKTHTLDTIGTKYIGYVEDAAGNFSTCEISIKKDSEKPICTNSGDSKVWTNNSREIKYGCSDLLSGCNKKYSGGSLLFTTTTKTSLISGYTVRDNAGNVTNCNERMADVYVDKTKPKCSNNGDSTIWTNKDRIIEYGCYDEESGCENDENKFITYSNTTKTSMIPSYTITDLAGNKTKCDERIANIYVDKTKPTCTYNKHSNENNGVDVEILCNDSESGCVTLKAYDYNIKDNKTYNLVDNVGNVNTCNVQVIKQMLRSDSRCVKYSICVDSSCGQEKYNCSDCKTGKNTCVSGYDYGSWGTCSLTKKECNSLSGFECESCGTNGYYHARTKTLNNCKNGENTCKYGCDTINKACRSSNCGCELYEDYSEFYNVTNCIEKETSKEKTKCKIIYK